MLVFLYVFILIKLSILLIFESVSPARTKLSDYEIKRRLELGDREAKQISRREKSIDYILSLKNKVNLLLIISITATNILVFDWLVGILLSVLITLTYQSVADIKFIKKISNYLYIKFEKRLLRLAVKLPKIIRLVVKPLNIDNIVKNLGSTAELVHLIDNSNDILTSNVKNLIMSGLSFDDQVVKTFMTDRSDIKFVDKSDFLGPLALDELHKLGHLKLPVIDGDLDAVVGILSLKRLLSLDIKKSTTVEKAMDEEVYYIRENHSLRYALSAFLRTHSHILIVINKNHETVGVLTLNDILRPLFGENMIDSFDYHDNIKFVANRD